MSTQTDMKLRKGRWSLFHKGIKKKTCNGVSLLLLIVAASALQSSLAFVLPLSPLAKPAYRILSSAVIGSESISSSSAKPVLSPFEINKAIVLAEGDTLALFSVMAKHLTNFDKVNCATMINR